MAKYKSKSNVSEVTSAQCIKRMEDLAKNTCASELSQHDQSTHAIKPKLTYTHLLVNSDNNTASIITKPMSL